MAAAAMRFTSLIFLVLTGIDWLSRTASDLSLWCRLLMLISIAFPIVDVRDFVCGAPGRLRTPNWPDAHPPEQKFVRAFGPIRRRPKGGAKEIGEGNVCDAYGSVRFPRFPEVDIDENNQIRFSPRFRRLFFDGRCVAKLEVGLAPEKKKPFQLNGESAVSLLKSIISCEITSASTKQLLPGEPKTPRTIIELNQLPDHVASLFFLATTNDSRFPIIKSSAGVSQLLCL
ncbi:hypothetical protein R5M92_14630 [Halomonas sp. Bachu 37]|uniref:hypothetical protein n=1 Tax=Halomonas kashgarensis TaxID=3084920 RepID=UPI003216FCF7